MRKIGIIQNWNDEKGFGFIKSGPNNDEYFFHINSFRNKGQRPFVGLEVNFEFGEDNRGRTQAVKVRTVENEKKPSSAGAFIIGAFFLILVGIICLIGYLPKAVWWLYVGASVWAFLLYYLDKSSAKKGIKKNTGGNTAQHCTNRWLARGFICTTAVASQV